MDWGTLATWAGVVSGILGAIGAVVVRGIYRDLDRHDQRIDKVEQQARNDVASAKEESVRDRESMESRMMDRIVSLEDWQKSGKGREP